MYIMEPKRANEDPEEQVTELPQKVKNGNSKTDHGWQKQKPPDNIPLVKKQVASQVKAIAKEPVVRKASVCEIN